MEVIDTNDALPCNAEVLKFLRENRSKLANKPSKDKGQAKAATVVLEALNYLEKTPAGSLAESMTSDTLNEFFDSIAKFNLSAAERLQVLNHCPKSAVEIQLLIEDSEERLSESDVEELLSLIHSHLLPPPPADEDESCDEKADDPEFQKGSPQHKGS